MITDAAIYTGHVVHKRLRPVPHALRYSVFALFIDTSKIGELAHTCRLFSHNRFNVFSLYDRDFGPGDGTAIDEIARRALKSAGRPVEGRSIRLLCYPRVFGYVFNPLSVYYVYDRQGCVETLIYEVSNTFGERTSYVLASGPEAENGAFAHRCAKDLYVSPFAPLRGDYSFRVTDPGSDAIVAVLFRDTSGPLIKTHFAGSRCAVSDATLAKLALRYPLLTLKVIAAIHFEALKLWLKGVPLTARKTSPRPSIPAAQHANEGKVN